MLDSLPKSITNSNGKECGISLHWSNKYQCFFIGYFGLRQTYSYKMNGNKLVGRGATVNEAVEDLIRRSR